MNKPSLRDIQQAFAASVFGDDAAVSGLLETNPQRFKVYRTSVLETYRQTLTSIFPVTCRLVGEQFFSQTATRFAHHNESNSGDLNRYGSAFPSFLESYRPARELAYLPDVARLEWCWHEAFHASDSQPLDMQQLATVNPVDYGRIVFRLQAGYRFLQSRYPVDRIWEVNQPQHADPETIQLDIEPRWLIIYRFDFEVRIANVSRGVYALTEALGKGMQLSDAAQSSLEAEADLQIDSTVRWLVSEQIINGFTLGGAPPNKIRTGPAETTG